MNVSDLIATAGAYGVKVVFSDLGIYSGHELRSEFDPSEPAIRINARLIGAMTPEQRGRFIAHAIGHELFHYFEHRGEIPTSRNRKAREEFANGFAQTLIAWRA